MRRRACSSNDEQHSFLTPRPRYVSASFSPVSFEDNDAESEFGGSGDWTERVAEVAGAQGSGSRRVALPLSSSRTKGSAL